MSTEFKFNSYPEQKKILKTKVTLTDLLYRMNIEKKIEKKRNIALSVAAGSAVMVFVIILTI